MHVSSYSYHLSRTHTGSLCTVKLKVPSVSGTTRPVDHALFFSYASFLTFVSNICLPAFPPKFSAKIPEDRVWLPVWKDEKRLYMMQKSASKVWQVGLLILGCSQELKAYVCKAKQNTLQRQKNGKHSRYSSSNPQLSP